MATPKQKLVTKTQAHLPAYPKPKVNPMTADRNPMAGLAQYAAAHNIAVPGQPIAAPTAIPATPDAGSAAGAAATPAKPADPRDSGYLATIAQNINTRDTGLGALKQQDEYDQTDATTSMQRLARQQVQALDNADVSANKSGLFYSGQLGKARGEIDQGYADQNTDITTRLGRANAAREGSRQQLLAQYGDPSKKNADGTENYGLAGGTAYADAIARHVGDPVPVPDIPDPPAASGPAPPQVLYDAGAQVRNGVKVGVGWQIIKGPDGKPQLKKVA